ncbi:MAG: hypothetical protein ACK5LV_10800 [Lachnospirales bacterium]
MGHQSAIENGIRYKTGGMGYTIYYPLCHKCFSEVFSRTYNPEKEYTCSSCKNRAKRVNYRAKGMARMRK